MHEMIWNFRALFFIPSSISDINFVQIGSLEINRKIGKYDFLIEKSATFRYIFFENYRADHIQICTQTLCRYVLTFVSWDFWKKKSVDFSTQVNRTQKNGYQSERVFTWEKNVYPRKKIAIQIPMVMLLEYIYVDIFWKFDWNWSSGYQEKCIDVYSVFKKS